MAPMAPEPEETIMLRKLSLVAVAAASLGVAALAPTSASAWYGHGGWHHGGLGHGGCGGGGAGFFTGGPPDVFGHGRCCRRPPAVAPRGPPRAGGGPARLWGAAHLARKK